MKWGVLLLLAGCQFAPLPPTADAGSGSDGGSGSGSLQGPLAFDVHGAFEQKFVTSQGQLLGYTFVLVDHDLGCAQLHALDGGPVPGAFHQVYAGVYAQQANSGPPPGTYQVLTNFPPGGGYAAFVSWYDFYGDGGNAGPFVATDGSITLTTSGDSELAGNFSATVPDANGQATNLTGAFDALACP
jgi:hypothetical protein